MANLTLDLDFMVPQVMAILNVTPDSFYVDSRMSSDEQIEKRVRDAVDGGATIIDVGGYSSRPGADEITVDDEWGRVFRGLTVIKKIAPDIAISVDTFRGEIAERAIVNFGSLIINDISAGEADDRILDVVAKFDVPYIAMHMRGTPATMSQLVKYDNIVDEVVEYFKDRVVKLKNRGVKQIIIDPGFGFAKSLIQNYELLGGLDKLCELGFPVLIGVSRKSMIYKILDTTPQNALTGTIALNWESLRQGATILRVHDTKEAVDTVNIFKAYKYDRN